MPIAPLQIPQMGAVSAVDWSGLERLGEQLKANRLNDQRREAVQAYANGDSKALLTGDLKLADLYITDQQRKQAQANADRAYAASRSDAAASQANSAAHLAIAREGLALRKDKTPEGFEPNPAYASDPSQPQYRPQSGGPKDPGYIAGTTKPRQLSIPDITKLSEEGGKYADLNRFSETFDDGYAGHTVLGDLPNTAGRYLPGLMVPENYTKGAAWWQDYDRHKNVVRNELFGASLTKGEQEAFMKADITPGMDPAQIRRNLATQKSIVSNGVRRKADAMIQSGYSPDAVSKAYGIDLNGVGVVPRGQPAAPASQGVVPYTSYFGGQQ